MRIAVRGLKRVLTIGGIVVGIKALADDPAPSQSVSTSTMERLVRDYLRQSESVWSL